jgi:hypothetical protein
LSTKFGVDWIFSLRKVCWLAKGRKSMISLFFYLPLVVVAGGQRGEVCWNFQMF